jgi:hypothetical protein
VIFVPTTSLLHPDTRRTLCGYLSNPVIAHTLQRTRHAVRTWGLSDLVPLPGGAQSIVLSARMSCGTPVVLKVPVLATAAREAGILALIPSTPRVLEVTTSALLLEWVPGTPVNVDDATTSARALPSLRALWGTPLRDDLRPWDEYLDEVLLSVARVERQSEVPALRELAELVLSERGTLVSGVDLVPAHGDFQPRNLLSGPAGVRVLDPFGIAAPLAWDSAFCAMSVTARGADPAPILRAAQELGITDLHLWLPVAALCHAGSESRVSDVGAARRVLEVLASFAPC